MSNIVDTSTDTIDAEFDAAADALGTDQPETTHAEQVQQEALEQAQIQAEIDMASGMIATALRFSIGGLVNVDVAEQCYTDTAQAYAVLIIKYFPGGIFALLDRYKEEIGATTATLVLIKVVRDAKRLREEKEAEAKKQNKKSPMATPVTPNNPSEVN